MGNNSYHPLSSRSETRFSNVNPLSMSYDQNSSPSVYRMELESVREETRSNYDAKEDIRPTYGNRSNYGDDRSSTMSAQRKKRERLDPAMMQPAGVQSNKHKPFKNKYSSHYYSEIDKLKNFSPGAN